MLLKLFGPIFKLIRPILGAFLNLLNQFTLPSPLNRSTIEQLKIDQETSKLVLYHFPGCPFCIKVRREIHRLNLKIELRDAQNIPEYRQELQAQGGMLQTPCLKILHTDGRTQWMYESLDINHYLRSRFATSAT